jgi:hypothetical protein
MSAMWLLQRRRVEQLAAGPARGRLLIALNGHAGIAVPPSLTPGLAPVGGQAMRPVPWLPWVRSVS